MSLYAIKNLEKYADEIRNAAANYISNDYTENLDDYITIKQLESFIVSKCDGYDEKGRLLIDSKVIDDIFVTTCDWIYGVGLARLASKNLIECAWDNDQNCMIFWKSDDETTQQSNTGNTTGN